jgi:tol-pal system protein YbgF
MKASAALLLVIILGMVLAAPPAYPQKVDEKVLLQNLSVDMINLKNTLKQMQDAQDHKSAETTKVLQDILKEVSTRFASMDANIQKLGDSLSGIKASDTQSQRDIQDARTSLEALKKIVDDGFVGLNNKTATLTRQLNEMKTVEQPLPGAGEVFQRAYADKEAGLYDLAIPEFRDFIKTYPQDQRTAVAQYHLADALFAQRKFADAVTEFEAVLTNHPDSDKKCSALYRKGQALVELKQTAPAKAALTDVGKYCPNTQEAVNAAAELRKLPAR